MVGVMRRLTASALVAAALAAASAALADPGLRSGRGPFVLTGTLASGSTSGEWGDSSSARTGTVLGCLSRRHYSSAITVRNRWKEAVTLTGARGPDPLRHVLARVAVQVRRAPAPSVADRVPTPLIRHWSSARAKPVTIEPGRSAVVQSNFLMRHCGALAHGRKIVVPGRFVLTYRVSGRSGTQRVVQRNAGFTVAPGPIARSCARVPGSVSIESGNLGCGIVREAATACRRMAHGTWGTCVAGGRRWGCHLHSSWVQECTFFYRTSRWYRVRWAKP